MAGEWVETTLGELIDIKHGFAFKGSFFRNDPPGDILLTPGNFAVGGGFKDDKLKYYDGPVPEDFILREGDLVVTMTDLSKNADTLGYPAVIPSASEGRKYLHNQRLGKITAKDEEAADLRYIHYLMCSKEYRHEIVAGASGTTVKHTSPKRIKQFKFRLPSFKEQRAIAHILGTLDDKIELNRRMNETVEEMARVIFKSWFVDFDPVRAKAEGRDPDLPEHIADLFPDRFEDSELGKIPAGWRVGTLDDVAENPRRGVQPSQIQETTPYIGLEHMPRKRIALTDWGNAENLESNKFEFKRGEILFGKLRPYFHKVGIAPVEGICSTDILVVAARRPQWFGIVLEHVSSVAFIDYVDAASTGTKMPRTNWKDMAAFQLAIPPLPVAEAFNDRIQPIADQIVANIHEAYTLAALRDSLLPKLISGELRVEEPSLLDGTS